MTDIPIRSEGALTQVAVRIVRAYAANNHVPASGLPTLIRAVHDTLDSLRNSPEHAAAVPERPSPAAIKASVTPDALTSFVDGRRYKTLKRHLAAHGLSPMAYRKRYGLPDAYPMVAQSYREERSRIAKSTGLGRPAER